MIDVIHHLIANNSLCISSNNFASTHPNSSYQDLSERANLTAHAYKFSYKSNVFIPRYLRSKIIMNFYTSWCCMIHFDLSKLTRLLVIGFSRFWAFRKLSSRRICLSKNRMCTMLQSEVILVCVSLLLIDHHFYVLLTSQILTSQLINNRSNY